MRIESAIYHSDEVSGCYVTDDGTRLYWTEGRSSTIVVCRPDGDVKRILVSQDCAITQMMEQAEAVGITNWRRMTPEEELQHTLAFTGGSDAILC